MSANVRDLLGEYLTGALSQRDRRRVEAALRESAALRGELEELRRLEGVLGTLSAVPPRRVRRAWRAAAAVLLALALGAGAFALLHEDGTDGAAGRLPGRLATGEPVPYGVPLMARAEGRVALGGQATLLARPESFFTVEGRDEVTLHRGTLLLDVHRAGGPPLVVRTPGGTASSGESRFRVEVREEHVMSAKAKTWTAVSVVTVAVITGAVVLSTDGDEEGSSVGAGETAIARDGSLEVVDRVPDAPGGPSPEVARLAARLTEEEGRNAELRKRIEELEETLRARREEVARLDAQLAEHVKERGVTIADVMGQIDQLRGDGLSAFLRPGATAQLVSDLKSLGAPGTHLVLELLNSEDSDARFLAAKLLEDLGDPVAIPSLEQAALHDGDTMVQRMSAHALALMDSPLAVPSLQRVLDAAKEEGVLVNTMFGLCKHDAPGSLERALGFLKEGKHMGPMQFSLAVSLLVLGEPRFTPVAETIMASGVKEPMLLEAVIGYYGGLETPEADTALQAIADDHAYPQAIRDKAREALNR